MSDPDLKADVAFAAGPEGDGPSTGFRRGETRHTSEFACVKCGEELILTPSTPFGDIKRALESHSCIRTALRAVKANAH